MRRARRSAAAIAALVWLACGPAGADETLAREPIEGTLDAGEERVFSVALGVGDFARVEVTQIGLDVALEVAGPDGAVLGRVDQAGVRESTETLGWIGSVAGPHRVVVRNGRTRSTGGRFLLRLEGPRPAGSAERLSLEAQRAFDEAGRTRDGGGDGSRARAIDGFARAAEGWRRSGERRLEARALVAGGVLEWVIEPESARPKCETALAIAQDTGDVAREG